MIGSRAFEIDRALVAANSRLLGFARAGGLVVVQYQQYQYVRGGFAPYPLEINRPHDRITDERAPVRRLAVDHAVFTTPNVLDERDWQGQVSAALDAAAASLDQIPHPDAKTPASYPQPGQPPPKELPLHSCSMPPRSPPALAPETV